MPQKFHLMVEGERRVKQILANLNEVTITSGEFAGIKVYALKPKNNLPAGCIGIILNPTDHTVCALHMQTTDQPAG